jgi:hypothetical protein
MARFTSLSDIVTFVAAGLDVNSAGFITTILANTTIYDIEYHLGVRYTKDFNASAAKWRRDMYTTMVYFESVFKYNKQQQYVKNSIVMYIIYTLLISTIAKETDDDNIITQAETYCRDLLLSNSFIAVNLGLEGVSMVGGGAQRGGETIAEMKARLAAASTAAKSGSKTAAAAAAQTPEQKRLVEAEAALERAKIIAQAKAAEKKAQNLLSPRGAAGSAANIDAKAAALRARRLQNALEDEERNRVAERRRRAIREDVEVQKLELELQASRDDIAAKQAERAAKAAAAKAKAEQWFIPWAVGSVFTAICGGASYYVYGLVGAAATKEGKQLIAAAAPIIGDFVQRERGAQQAQQSIVITAVSNLQKTWQGIRKNLRDSLLNAAAQPRNAMTMGADYIGYSYTYEGRKIEIQNAFRAFRDATSDFIGTKDTKISEIENKLIEQDPFFANLFQQFQGKSDPTKAIKELAKRQAEAIFNAANKFNSTIEERVLGYAMREKPVRTSINASIPIGPVSVPSVGGKRPTGSAGKPAAKPAASAQKPVAKLELEDDAGTVDHSDNDEVNNEAVAVEASTTRLLKQIAAYKRERDEAAAEEARVRKEAAKEAAEAREAAAAEEEATAEAAAAREAEAVATNIGAAEGLLNFLLAFNEGSNNRREATQEQLAAYKKQLNEEREAVLGKLETERQEAVNRIQAAVDEAAATAETRQAMVFAMAEGAAAAAIGFYGGGFLIKLGLSPQAAMKAASLISGTLFTNAGTKLGMDEKVLNGLSKVIADDFKEKAKINNKIYKAITDAQAQAKNKKKGDLTVNALVEATRFLKPNIERVLKMNPAQFFLEDEDDEEEEEETVKTVAKAIARGNPAAAKKAIADAKTAKAARAKAATEEEKPVAPSDRPKRGTAAAGEAESGTKPTAAEAIAAAKAAKTARKGKSTVPGQNSGGGSRKIRRRGGARKTRRTSKTRRNRKVNRATRRW